MIGVSTVPPVGQDDDHRTASGAIPEKVLAGGAPAAVAPLTWSSANVVLAVAALEDAGAL